MILDFLSSYDEQGHHERDEQRRAKRRDCDGAQTPFL